MLSQQIWWSLTIKSLETHQRSSQSKKFKRRENGEKIRAGRMKTIITNMEDTMIVLISYVDNVTRRMSR